MKKANLKIPKIEQLPSGAYHTRVMIDGMRHTITKDTYEECAAEAAAIKYRAKQAQKKERSGIKPLADVLDRYIEARRGAVSPATVYAYENYKKNCFQSMMKANVCTTTDDQWQAAVKREAKGKSPKYIANVWGFVAAAITEATGRRPKVNLPAKERNQRPFLDPDQIEIFLDAVKDDTVEIAALLALSSLRRSEIKALTWDKIDFVKNTITVSGAMVYAGKEAGMVHKRQNKTASSQRTVPMIPQLRAALETTQHKSEYVVPYNGSWLYQRINEICEKASLPQVGVHGLRHSFASLAYHLNIPEKIAMQIGGWSDDGTMRKIYTHLAEKDIAAKAADFTNFFASKMQK